MTLQNETGRFLLSFYGNSLSLGFKGEPEFIERCYNWAHNHGVTRGHLHWFYDRGGKMAYILVRSREQIMHGLIAQFRSDIIMNREIAPLRDEFDENTGEPMIEYNEVKIGKLAKERAEKFFEDRIELDNFQTRIKSSLAPVYDISDKSMFHRVALYGSVAPSF